MDKEFIVFPAIDLRGGQVVRLEQGDPQRQKVYGTDPGRVAQTWLEKGARWLHVVNLDGAFGETDGANRAALRIIVQQAEQCGASVQFGGGLRGLEALAETFALGVGRAVLGTAALEDPALVGEALQRWGKEKIAVGLDARRGKASTRGWTRDTGKPALEVALEWARVGLEWLIFTDIARDGLQGGINLEATRHLAEASGLRVVASGGASHMQDVEDVYRAGLSGVIIGKALYEGAIDLSECLSVCSKP